MKKRGFIVLLVVLLAILICSGAYFVDCYSMKHNLPVVFSTWGYSYTPPLQEKQDETGNFNGERSFVGTVLEETITYMIVEPAEDEEERRLAEKIRIEYGTDHYDYLYGVGRNVVIYYHGPIVQSAPGGQFQIVTDDISTDGFRDFSLSVKPSHVPENKLIIKNRSQAAMLKTGTESIICITAVLLTF